MYADVLLFRGVPTSYTYQIPENLAIEPGDHVEVPFGRSTCKGCVLAVSSTLSKEMKLKDILGKTNHPKLTSDTLDLILWLAKTYLTNPYTAYQTVVGNRKYRDLSIENPVAKPPLIEGPPPTPEQQEALSALTSAKGFHQFLLHGVTSSGKTEVYIRLAEHMRLQGKQCLILIPEISLTPQFSEAFRERFEEDIAILHSGLTPKQRDIEWNKCYQEKVSIVIGPRSAVFASFKSLGAIVIDEEHDPSYKQDNHPRYYTHTIAQYRASKHQALLIFGSATPSIDTYFRPDIRHLTLKTRVLNRTLPQVKLVDEQALFEQGCYDTLSPQLVQAIAETLAKKQKVIILNNRRGFSPYIACQKCGKVYACPSCGLSYTYHKNKTMSCHRCQVTIPVTNTCPTCKKPSLAFSGTGIQKVELALKQNFPEAHIIRLDKDTASTSKKLHELLSQFKKEGEILVGTQWISKGHHIDQVTLVGVIGIDTTLNIPDFRASERTFQLLTQVAGRSGRGQEAGSVIVQTHHPSHYALLSAAAHDFNQFYDQEIQFREALEYPPFTELIHVVVSSPDEIQTQKQAKVIFHYLSLELQEPTFILIGPNPSPVEKRSDHYRWSILIKSKLQQPEPVYTHLRSVLTHLPALPSQVRVIVDLDPRSIL